MKKRTSGLIKEENMDEKMSQLIPLKRIGDGDDIANTIISYATNIRLATGNIVVIDGGKTA